MRSRCRNPNCPAFKNYGGRGITVCERWSDFRNFYADMGEAPPGMWIERVDNNAGYSPENCVWATRSEQMRNRRITHMLTMGGETKALSAWAEQYGLRIGTLHLRLKNGWPVEAAITTPLVKDRAGKPRGSIFHDSSEGPDRANNPAGAAA